MDMQKYRVYMKSKQTANTAYYYRLRNKVWSECLLCIENKTAEMRSE